VNSHLELSLRIPARPYCERRVDCLQFRSIAQGFRAMADAKTIFDKIWENHVVAEREDGARLLYIDRLLLQENSFHAFDKLRREGRKVRNPGQAFAFADHYVPTLNRERGLDAVVDPEIRKILETFEADTRTYGIQLFGMGDVRQGILHVVGPEQGITQPGLVIAGADSHTSTHGALGAYAFGIGASEVAHTLAVQGLWRTHPKTMRIVVADPIPPGTTAKDLILTIIGRIGVDGARGHVIEYAGGGIAAHSATCPSRRARGPDWSHLTRRSSTT
jgi:3-isopropylmalate/(R)-2-methylmalate dehydratase large subunit